MSCASSPLATFRGTAIELYESREGFLSIQLCFIWQNIFLIFGGSIKIGLSSSTLEERPVLKIFLLSSD